MSYERAVHYFGDFVKESKIEEICREVAEELQFNAAEMMVPYEESEKEAEKYGLCTSAADNNTACHAGSVHNSRANADWER